MPDSLPLTDTQTGLKPYKHAFHDYNDDNDDGDDDDDDENKDNDDGYGVDDNNNEYYKKYFNCNDAVFDNSGADLLYVGFHMQTKFELYNLAQNHFSFCT